jgi:phage gp45-like
LEKQFFRQEGTMPYQVVISAVPIGSDLVVMLWGGERPHVGAVAVSIHRPSLDNSEVTSATTSVYALVGHKEDDLAKMMAHKIASTLNKNIILTAGIHVDNISADGIKTIETNCLKVLDSLISYYLAQ